MKNNEDMSLVALMRDNPDYMERIEKISKEVKKDKPKIMKIAGKYNQKYEKQISEGTVKRQVLLTEGTKSGRSIEDVQREMGFIPSVYTPILNWLYFWMQEDEDKNKLLREQQEKEYGNLLHDQQNINEMEKIPEAFVFLSGKVTNEQFQKLKKLKRLALKNNDEHEAFQAYRKCLQLCEFFEVDFDRVPIE